MQNLREGDGTGVNTLGMGRPWAVRVEGRPWPFVSVPGLPGNQGLSLFFGFLPDKIRLGQNPRIISKITSISEIP